MAERVIYRDEDEFNEAIDHAAEVLGEREDRAKLGSIIWFGLIGLLAVLYIDLWALDWGLRRIIPGIDLIKWAWVAFGAAIVYHHVWSRNQHDRILKNRLCLGCGGRLLGVDVNDEGDGKCPECEREFNLGEYRRPSDNRGRAFREYIDRDHYDKALFAAAEQIKTTRAFGLEAQLMGWAWIAIIAGFALSLLGWDPLDDIRGGIPVYLIAFVLLLAWGAWYSARVKRLRASIADRRLCFNCGYSLLHTPTDDGGIGRCPECGEAFATAQYVAPEASREDDATATADKAL